MKPLYVKKNGVVSKVSGIAMPANYPGENVTFDNTITSELQSTNVQDAIDELSTRPSGVQSDWNENDTAELDYIKNKPQNLVQDASYVHTDNNYDATAKNKVDLLGTASTKDAPASGNASTTQVVMGDDTRLTDARPASDVSAWAKADTKPTYTASEVGAIASTLKGAVNGVAELDAAGKVPSSQLPSFVDDVIEVADYDHLPITGESGKIYVTLDTNKTYRWAGSGYAEISESLALGETSSTAYRGDRGKTAYDHSQDTGRITTAVSSGLYKFSATAQGHISGTTAVQKSDITALGIPAQDTTYNDATTSVSGLMSANDKTKLDNIAVARFGNTADSQSKKIKIKINNESRWMLAFTVTLYKDYKATKVMISGYNFTSYWHRPAAVILGKSYDDNVNVYFGYDSLNNLWVGFDGGSYKGVSISDVANGFQQISNYDGLFTISEVDTLTTLQTTLVATSTTRVESSTTNGNIKIDSVETPVYRNYGNNTVLTTDKTPFLTRQTLNPTGFSGYVREKLIGASYAWNNQLINGNFATTDDWFGRDSNPISVSGNILTLTTTSGSLKGLQQVVSKQKILANHKYLLIAWVKSSIACSNVDINMATAAANKSISANVWTQVSRIWTYSSDATSGLYVLLTGSFSGGETIQYKEVQIIDLTLAFGSTIADYLYGLSNNGGITKLRDMGCPIDKYTAYGNYLVSSKTSGKKIVGKNLFGGVYDVVYPLFIPKGTVVTASINYHGTPFSRVDYFDKNGNTIDYWNVGATSAVSASRHRRTFTILEDAYSFKFTAAPCEDMQIEIGEDDTTYEPYCGYEISLGNDELRGKFDLVDGEIVASGDVKESNGEITRIRKRIELNSLTYIKSNSNRFYANISDKADTSSTMGAMMCSNYTYTYNSGFSIADKCIGDAKDSSYYKTIFIYDSAYASYTPDQFKSAMAGVYLEYDLATPTTEQSTPFADPMSMVGATTEEYIDTRDIPCPVGAERQYMGQSEDVVEIPSSPQSDGKRVLINEVSGGKEQVYWDIPKLYYKEYTVQGDGTKTYGDLLTELKPYYEALSEDEKTYSKVMMRANATGNECLAFVGNYWYSRMGVNASGLWIDQIDFQYIKYYRGTNGQAAEDLTNTSAGNYTIALRVLTYTRAES